MKTIRRITRRKNKLQVIAYLVFFIVLVIFLLTVGIKLLVNSIFFIVDLMPGHKNSKSAASQNQEFFVDPEIIDIPNATNSARIRVAGIAPDNMPVTLFVNGEEQKNIIATDGTFEAILTLTEDRNDIYAQVENSITKKKKNSRIYYVRLIIEKPQLTISSPTDGAIVDNQDIYIEGITDEDVLVKINGLPVVTDSQGKFSHSIRLSEGSNTIIVEAVDIAGNSEQKTLTITYEKI